MLDSLLITDVFLWTDLKQYIDNNNYETFSRPCMEPLLGKLPYMLACFTLCLSWWQRKVHDASHKPCNQDLVSKNGDILSQIDGLWNVSLREHDPSCSLPLAVGCFQRIGHSRVTKKSKLSSWPKNSCRESRRHLASLRVAFWVIWTSSFPISHANHRHFGQNRTRCHHRFHHISAVTGSVNSGT